MSGNIAIFVPHSGCPQQCSFCNQRAISGAQKLPTPEEVAAICRTALDNLPSKTEHIEIAFFGGSFTAIPEDYMIKLLETVQEYLSDSRVKGIRLSTRPDAIDSHKLAILKEYGVTAIELGAQSMCDNVLRLNKRGHTSTQVREAAKMIKDNGFSLGLQMMTGLYGSTSKTDYETAQILADLEPDTIRIYPTVVLQGTDLAELMKQGLYEAPNVEQTVPLCVQLIDLFTSRNIKIIRLGLHSSETMEQQIIGGCYHPALGELCIGERFYNEILQEIQVLGGNSFEIHVLPAKLSQICGQRKVNLARFKEKGYNIKIINDGNLTGKVYSIISVK